MHEVEIRRSTRRKRTVQARLEGGTIVVMVPAGLEPDVENSLVADLVAKVRRRTEAANSEDLVDRAERIRKAWFPQAPQPESVEWVSNQATRWGSCTPSTGRLRISDRIAAMPDWVIDYVIAHELVHLVHANHSDQFWQLLNRYPRAAEAKAFLQGVSWQQQRAT